MNITEALSAARVNVARIRRKGWPPLAYLYHTMDGSSDYAYYYDRRGPRIPDRIEFRSLPKADDWEPYDGPLDPADDRYKALEIVVVYREENDSEAVYLDGLYEYSDDELAVSATAIAEIANGRYFRLVTLYVKNLAYAGGKWPKRLEDLRPGKWPDAEPNDWSGIR